MYKIYEGVVARGFQFASGEAVNRKTNPSPFSAGTLELQHAHFKARDFDLLQAIPDLYWGTINLQIEENVKLASPDSTFSLVDWTRGEKNPEARIKPETFSFIRCCFAYLGDYHSGYLYYPHPETKPVAVNGHSYNVLEVLTSKIDSLAYGEPAAVICREDVFVTF